MADFMARYADADLTDVALVFAADRERIYNILTVDRKDFDRYRSPAGKRLRRSWLVD
jgi:predicted nucleic acid-binding protein